MRCDECREVVDAYLDGELMPHEADAVREHLDTCETCGAERDVMLALSQRVRSGLVRSPAPDLLKARIRAALAHEMPPADAQPPAVRPHWVRLAAAGVAIALFSAGVTYSLARRGSASPVVGEQVLSSHIRSLMPGHLTDVASTDLHNVKPWFNGRLDLSPSVPRLDSAGFPLVGGRLDYVGGRSVAAVVYMRRQHVINVFSWPVDAGSARDPQVSTEKGYHLVRWSDGGAEFWAVSDLSTPDLELFVSLFRRAQ
ncbi:MAG TPA: anti-sigma factor [Gemmatimonadaceae bacterium]|jgi:anti-sigma factor (TIGR02949 family)|nr:anti-sigma factor [Gemmatimonadaceae bacterium]